MEEEAACVHALQYLSSHLASMVLQAAVELDVFGIIERAGPGAHLSAREIASQMTTPSSSPQPGRPVGPESGELLGPRLDGMLRLLVTHAFLSCTLRTSTVDKVERAYGIAPPARFFLGSPDHGSLVSTLEFSHHPTHMQMCSRVKEAIFEGGSQFEKVYGASPYKIFGNDPKYSKTFNDSMVGYTALAMGKILQVYKGFEGINSIVDVGGGKGKLMSMISSKYPSIHCVNFDLPHVIKTAPSYPGVLHVEGDMFVSVPKADCILIKEVLHNWNDEHCLKLLKKFHEALPEKGKVIVIALRQKDLPDSNLSSRYVAETDFVMQMVFTGYERSEKEVEALCMASGFSSVRVVCSAYEVWDVVEVLK